MTNYSFVELQTSEVCPSRIVTSELENSQNVDDEAIVIPMDSRPWRNRGGEQSKRNHPYDGQSGIIIVIRK